MAGYPVAEYLIAEYPVAGRLAAMYVAASGEPFGSVCREPVP